MPYFFSTHLLRLLLSLLQRFPNTWIHTLSRLGGHWVDKHKGRIARAALLIARPNENPDTIDAIARKAAYHGMHYILSIPRIDQIPYQLHNLNLVTQTLAYNKGAIIVSLHMGPPDLATFALTRENIPITTVIGAGNQKPVLNELGQNLLQKKGIRFAKRGDPMAVMKVLRRKEAIILHSDMRSREAPVTFFGQKTTAPISAIKAALLLQAPIIFHFCTLENNVWQLHFEPFEIGSTENDNPSAEECLQSLMHKMETVISAQPELWIWHYDRFKLKKRL